MSWDTPHQDKEKEAFDYVNDGYEDVYEYEEELASRSSIQAIRTEAGPPAVKLKSTVAAEDELSRIKSDIPRYGEKVSPEYGDELMAGEGGLIYTALLVSDEYTHPKNTRKDGSLKTRRPMPQVRCKDFFSSLTKTTEGKWVFNGVLNGWPALTSLQLLKMEYVYLEGTVPFAKQYWKAGEEGNEEAPYFPEAGVAFFLQTPQSVRITLRKPAWSSHGYSEDSLGFFFWYAFRPGGNSMAHGENVVKAIEEDGMNARAVRAHMIAHRYARAKGETAKDRLTYHTAVLLEWDHGKHCTVVELAWLNGLGGYGGKSNWCEDKDAKRPALYDAMPACMKSPWSNDKGEIRAIDVNIKTVQEFKKYMKKYEGKRFLAGVIADSEDIRTSFNTQRDIAQCLVNYSYMETAYSEAMRNCQTFAADFFGFLTGKDSEPYHAVNKVLYFRKRDYFLYKPDLIKDKKSMIGIRSLGEMSNQLRDMTKKVSQQQKSNDEDNSGLIQTLNEMVQSFRNMFGASA